MIPLAVKNGVLYLHSRIHAQQIHAERMYDCARLAAECADNLETDVRLGRHCVVYDEVDQYREIAVMYQGIAKASFDNLQGLLSSLEMLSDTVQANINSSHPIDVRYN